MEMLMIALIVFMTVFMIVVNWKIFVKMNEAGWKSLIPIYSTYVRFKRLWNGKAAVIVLVSNVAAVMTYIMFIFAVLKGVQAAGAEGISDESMGKMVLSELPSLFFMTISVSMWLIITNKQAEAFGKGVGTTLGLIFLPLIFAPILAFGSAQYRDSQEQTVMLPEANGFNAGF